jgi:hypothetical protein
MIKSGAKSLGLENDSPIRELANKLELAAKELGHKDFDQIGAIGTALQILHTDGGLGQYRQELQKDGILTRIVDRMIDDDTLMKEGLGEKIRVRVPFVNRIEIMTLQGIGAWPYDCIAKDKYPDDKIYANDISGWINESKLVWNSDDQYYEIK